MNANFRGIFELILRRSLQFPRSFLGHFPIFAESSQVKDTFPITLANPFHPLQSFLLFFPSCFPANSTAAYITLRFVKQTIKICKKKVDKKCAGVFMLEQILFLPFVLLQAVFLLLLLGFGEKCSTVAELRVEF